MKVESQLYYALMLAQLTSGQDLPPLCEPGPVLYAGTWSQHMAPNIGVQCQKASILFPDQEQRKNVTIEYSSGGCGGYPLMNITIPLDIPPGSGSMQMFCDGRENVYSYCQMITVEKRPPDDTRKASATEYAITQDCAVTPPETSAKYAGTVSKPSSVSTPTPKVVAPIGTAPTQVAKDTQATPTNQTPTNQTPTNQTPTKELSGTMASSIDAEEPDPTNSGRGAYSDTDSSGAMPTGMASHSQSDGLGAAQTTQLPGYSHEASTALPESVPVSPSNEAQASGENHPCTCGQ
ncbi:hypothetical protein FMUND_10868 [Fusarium mundagurra]|uniref:Uncharacterized protein n=1 Tax=Fusarium mundagurra TaxID=1567541 RepID=A0A8H5Y8D0_9HYPO|nr:hypothetical protein FMUND_10868 [Fusarium mundagurra]